MWTRFTERSRRTVFFAQEEAARLGEDYVSTEHLLLGLVREDDTVAARVLDRLHIFRSRIRSEVEQIVVPGEGRSGQDQQLTLRANRVIDLAYDEAKRLDNPYIGTEHLLLGLIREEEGIAGRVLHKVGVDLGTARQEVLLLQQSKNLSESKDAVREFSTAEKELIAHKMQKQMAKGKITQETVVMLKGLVDIAVTRGEDKNPMISIYASDLLLLLNHLRVTDTTTGIDEELDESG